MSPSKAFKTYLKKLRASGLPTCKAKLLELSEMGQSAAFQWFMDNRYTRPSVDALASDEGSWLDEVIDGEIDEDEAEIAPAIVEAAAKPKATRKSRRKVDVSASDEDSRWSAGLFERYSITPKIGSEFKSKHGTTFVVTSVAADHVRAARKA